MTNNLTPATPITSSTEAINYIAARIKLVRKLRKITLNTLADKLGITRKQLQNYESAQSNISVKRLWEISQLLDTDMSFFVDGLTTGQPLLSNNDLSLVQAYRDSRDHSVRELLLNLMVMIGK